MEPVIVAKALKLYPLHFQDKCIITFCDTSFSYFRKFDGVKFKVKDIEFYGLVSGRGHGFIVVEFTPDNKVFQDNKDFLAVNADFEKKGLDVFVHAVMENEVVI